MQRIKQKVKENKHQASDSDLSAQAISVLNEVVPSESGETEKDKELEGLSATEKIALLRGKKQNEQTKLAEILQKRSPIQSSSRKLVNVMLQSKAPRRKPRYSSFEVS